MGLNKDLKGERLPGYKSVNETAKEFGISRQRVQQLIADEELAPVNHVDGFYLVPDETVAKEKAKREQEAAQKKKAKKTPKKKK